MIQEWKDFLLLLLFKVLNVTVYGIIEIKPGEKNN